MHNTHLNKIETEIKMSKMIDFLKNIFHKCKMKTVDIPHSNKKGEIWIQECVCGKQQEVMFNHNGECVRIKSKPR